jgi:hypothetical protein
MKTMNEMAQLFGLTLMAVKYHGLLAQTFLLEKLLAVHLTKVVSN